MTRSRRLEPIPAASQLLSPAQLALCYGSLTLYLAEHAFAFARVPYPRQPAAATKDAMPIVIREPASPATYQADCTSCHATIQFTRDEAASTVDRGEVVLQVKCPRPGCTGSVFANAAANVQMRNR